MRYLLFFLLGVTLVQCQEEQWRKFLHRVEWEAQEAFRALKEALENPTNFEDLVPVKALGSFMPTIDKGQWKEDTLNDAKRRTTNLMNGIKARMNTVDDEFLEKMKIKAMDGISEMESLIKNFDKDSITEGVMPGLKLYSDVFDSKVSDIDTVKIEMYKLKIRNWLSQIGLKMAKIDEASLQESKATVGEWIINVEKWLATFNQDSVENGMAMKADWMDKVEDRLKAVSDKDLEDIKTQILTWFAYMKGMMEEIDQNTVEVYKGQINDYLDKLDLEMADFDTQMAESTVSNAVQWMSESKTQIEKIGLCAWKHEQIETLKRWYASFS